MARGRAVVVSDPTVLVRWSNRKLVLERLGVVVKGVPIAEVVHVALHGPITMTGAAVRGLLDAGVDVSLHARSGRLRGLMSAREAKDVALLLAQVGAWHDMAKRLAFARPLVVSKIEGQRRMLQRHGWNHGHRACLDAAADLTKLQRKALAATELDELMGLEGAAAAAYFGQMGKMLRGGFTFAGRVRRPPTDPVNSLLSYGYALAVGEVARQVLVRGLDGRIGLLHGIRYGRTSLALDLVEELRTPMVDRLVLKLLNRQQVLHRHFVTLPDGAVRLTDEGRRIFLLQWELMLAERPARRATTSNTSDDDDDSAAGPSWRHRIVRQVGRLKRFLLHGKPFRPLFEGASLGQRDREGGLGNEAATSPSEQND